MRIVATAAISAALVLAAGSSAAQAPPLQVTYPTDPSMTCEQLVSEVARMDQLMTANAQGMASAQGGAQAANLGQTVAIEGLARSGVLGRMPGIGMFANAAGGMAKQSAAAKQKLLQDEMQTAQTRKTVMIGLYQGRGCGAPQPAAIPQSTPASTGG